MIVFLHILYFYYRSAVELFETYSMAAMTFNPPVESSHSKRKVCDTFFFFFFFFYKERVNIKPMCLLAIQLYFASFVFFFETGHCFVVQANLELTDLP
jgi:hypothetical protein